MRRLPQYFRSISAGCRRCNHLTHKRLSKGLPQVTAGYRRLPQVTAILCGLALSACSPKVLPPVIEYRDSVRVEVHERLVHDTVSFEVPVIIEKNVTRDTASHLENAWAKSDASLIDGFLEHTLETKGQTVYIPVQVTVHDTVTVEKLAETRTEYIERDLTEKEKRLIRRGRAVGWVLALLAIAGLAAVAIKISGFDPVRFFRRKV